MTLLPTAGTPVSPGQGRTHGRAQVAAPPSPAAVRPSVFIDLRWTQSSRLIDGAAPPFVGIGGRPLLWHALSVLAGSGCRDFVLDTAAATLPAAVSSGLDANVRVRPRGRLQGDGAWLIVRPDVLSDIDVPALLDFHRGHGRLATLVTVRLPSRFGRLHLDGDCVTEFAEKPPAGEGWLSGGYILLEPAARHLIGNDDGWEASLIERLTVDRELAAFKHHSFWCRLETLHESRQLEELWQTGQAPWKAWE
jgi:glucose-1-phosphate cytidylyltransferase